MTRLRALAPRIFSTLAATLAFVGCHRADLAARSDGTQRPAASASASAASTSTGTPLSRLVPPSRPGLRPTCPLAIEPGVGLGPVLLGETVADLERAGLRVKVESDTHAEVTLDGGLGDGATLRVTLCEGKIIGVSIDDLRTAPACVSFGGKAIASSASREEVESLLGPCVATAPRIGGVFERCADGGVYVGHGLGTFLQIRVMPKDFPFDDTCAVATDDGSPVSIPDAERESMLRATLNLPDLSGHWHVDLPGRDPLRVVRTHDVPEFEFMEFGSPVVWIDERDATQGTAYFRVRSLSATKTRATLRFEYPIEGVVGVATFRRMGGRGDWLLDRSEVRGR